MEITMRRTIFASFSSIFTIVGYLNNSVFLSKKGTNSTFKTASLKQCLEYKQYTEQKIQIKKLSTADLGISEEVNDSVDSELDFTNNDWNIVTYNYSTHATTYEFFNPNAYPKRGSSRGCEVEKEYSINRELFLNDGTLVQYTKGFFPYGSGGNRNQSGIVGNDDRFRIYNPNTEPYCATGFILSRFRRLNQQTLVVEEFSTIGTGFMLGPNLLVTAAHVICGNYTTGVYDDGNPYADWAHEIYFYPAMNGFGNAPYGAIAISEVSIHKNYYTSFSGNNDWAACLTSTEIGNTVGWYSKAAQYYETNGSIYSYGYPGDKNREMWQTNGNFIGSDDYIYYTNLDIVGGQSGSPLFADTNLDYLSIGIAAFSYDLSGMTLYTGATRFRTFNYAFFNSFITSFNWPNC